MEPTPCPATVLVGEAKAGRHGTVTVHCVRTDQHTLHRATLFSRTREWTQTEGAQPQIREW